MDHDEARRVKAVEQYLFDELSQEQQDAFEAHYFECQECAAALQAATLLLDALATKKNLSSSTQWAALPGAHTATRWGYALLSAAACTLLVVVGYQNLVLYPRLHAEIARLTQPGLTPLLGFEAGTSMGDEADGGVLPSVAVTATQHLSLSVDIPPGEQLTRYECRLLALDGRTLWSVPVSRAQARDTVSITVPPGTLPPGQYTLLVQGYPAGDSAHPTALARHRFALRRPG